MAAPKISFARPGERFIAEVKAEVAAYFAERGLSPHADARMVAKTVVLLTVTFGAYGLILSDRFGPWTMLELAVLMGVGTAGIGFSVAHDALHGAYSANPRINRWLGFSFDLMGANGYMWKITHNVIHHTYTNIDGVDEDLVAAAPLLRLSPGAPRHWFHRFQHVYAFAAYALASLNWVFLKDYQQFLKRDLGPYRNKKHPRAEVAHLAWTKALYYGYTLVLPLLLLRSLTWWQVLLGFLAMHLTAGLILGVVFQLAHVVEGPEYPSPDPAGHMDSAWVIHEMRTTADFAPRNRPLTWYIGGLNYQVEHHLFPHVCSVHYPALAPIVRAAAERHGVPYHCNPTLRTAIRSHAAMLRRLGRPPAQAAPSADAPA